jgi:hypothetical protein
LHVWGKLLSFTQSWWLFVSFGERAMGLSCLLRWGCARVVLRQEPVAAMAGGMRALEGAAGGLALLLVGLRMGLAAVQAAQVAHHADTPLLYHGPAQRAVPGQEQGPQSPHASFLPYACPAQNGVRDP